MKSSIACLILSFVIILIQSKVVLPGTVTRDETFGNAAGQGQASSVGIALGSSESTGGDSAAATGTVQVTGCAVGTGGSSVSLGSDGTNVATGGGNGTLCGSGSVSNLAQGTGAGSTANASGDVDLQGYGSGWGEGLVVNTKGHATTA